MKVNTYVNFGGKCRDAMNFYKDILGGEVSIMTVSETPVAAQCPEFMQDQVMHSALTKDGTPLLMGSDMTGPGGITIGNNMAVTIDCDSEEQINAFYTKLGEGGKVLDELSVKFWGGMFGVVDDKFGVRWMFNYDKK